MTNDVVTNSNGENTGKEKNLHFFEKYLTLWVLLCIAAGMIPHCTGRNQMKQKKCYLTLLKGI